MRKVYRIPAAAVCIALALPAAAERPVPKRVFACQVSTASGTSGLVNLQSFSRESALENASGKIALTMAGKREPALSVVQCIEKFTLERFADSAFQRFVDSVAE